MMVKQSAYFTGTRLQGGQWGGPNIKGGLIPQNILKKKLNSFALINFISESVILHSFKLC